MKTQQLEDFRVSKKVYCGPARPNPGRARTKGEANKGKGARPTPPKLKQVQGKKQVENEHLRPLARPPDPSHSSHKQRTRGSGILAATHNVVRHDVDVAAAFGRAVIIESAARPRRRAGKTSAETDAGRLLKAGFTSPLPSLHHSLCETQLSCSQGQIDRKNPHIFKGAAFNPAPPTSDDPFGGLTVHRPWGSPGVEIQFEQIKS